MPSARPDQALVCAGQQLDRLRVWAVAGDQAVVVPVDAHQVGQQFGIGGIGLGARYVVAVAVPGHRQRVDRIHLIAGGDQRSHPQAAVGFDPNHHLIGILSMRGDQLV
jgi:hypothetical protein